METLYIEQIGFMRPTIVRYGNKTIISTGLNVKDLCKFWRQELELYDKNYTLIFLSAKEFRGAGQRTLHGTKTLIEIFAENGFKCELLDKDN